MAGAAALALLTAAEHGAGPVGYGLLVLAATGAPWLGLRLTRVTLPALSRRRLLAVSLLVMGAALILAGLVFDYVLILLLTVLAGAAAGIVVGIGRALLEQEVEEARLPRVTEHLYAVLRAVVATALVAVPLIAAAYGAGRLRQPDPRQLHLHPRRRRARGGHRRRADAGAGGRRAAEDGRPARDGAVRPRAAGGARRRAAPTRRTGPPAVASSSPWRAATAPASPPRRRRWPSGSAARATRSC